MKSDTVTVVSPSRGPVTPPERMGLADAVVQKQFAPGEKIEITNRRFKGDSAWVNVQHTPTTWTIFTLVWVNDAWKVAQRTASSR